MTLETQVNEISIAYAAKSIAPYLKVTVPEPPKEWRKIQRAMVVGEKMTNFIEWLDSAYLFFADKERYREKRKYMNEERIIEDGLQKSGEEDDAEYLRELNNLSIITPQEINSYTIVSAAGRAMKSFVIHSNIHKEVDGFEV